MATMITLSDVFERCEGYIASDMDGEKVMLSIQKGKYYNLGEVGGRIWDLLRVPSSVRQIMDGLLLEYDVNHTVGSEQVVSFLQHLLTEELIRDSKPG
jgi:hypothetical protein